MISHSPRGVWLARSATTSLWENRSVRAFAIFVVSVLIRIPFQASYLVNWDSVNFALGVGSFDLESHQPHPPGYIGYVLLGRFIAWVVGDPVTALTAISVVAGAAATMWTYVLATKLVSERAALIAAALFGTSPLVWYYSEVALTYIVEVALALPFVILMIEAMKRHSWRFFTAATLVLALMGAVRQTSLVFFLPLWVFGWLRLPRRARAPSVGLLIGATLVWLIPLLVMSGGPIEYLRVSRQLAELTGGVTWLGAGLGVLRNFVIVSIAIVLGMHVSLLALPLRLRRGGPFGDLTPDLRRMLLLWGLPPLLTFLLLHSGQLGYVLILLPIGIVWAAGMFDQMSTVPVLKLALTALLVTVNGVGFFVLPEIAYATVAEGKVAIPEEAASETLVQRGIQQVSIPRSDQHWEAVIAWVERFDPEKVAVLAEPRDGGSFRHLAFYLPDYLVHAVGKDRDGVYGHLFTSVRHRINYSVEGLEESADHLDLSAAIEVVLIPDPGLQELFQDTLDLQRATLSGIEVAYVVIPPHSSLWFHGSTGTPSLRPPTEGFSSLSIERCSTSPRLSWGEAGHEPMVHDPAGADC